MSTSKIRHKLFGQFLRMALSLRYRVEVRGFNRSIKKKLKKEGGILFLPNHPAEVDPVIIQSILMKDFVPRPLVVEHFYYASGMNTFMRLVDAFPIPNIETTASSWKIKQVDKAFQTVKAGLQRGDNFLIYPSGHLKKEGYEVIGGNSFIQRLVEECPDVTIVLLRTTGLWGSLFSRAITGEVPSFWNVLKKGFKILLRNGFFFAPRRKVLVECEVNPKNFPKGGDRLKINKFLEGWYNTYLTENGDTVIEEPLTLVSFKRNKQEFPEITKVKNDPKVIRQHGTVTPQQKKDILHKLAEIASVSASKIKEEMELASDLALDSLDVAKIYTFLSEDYGVKDLPPSAIRSVSDILDIVGSRDHLILGKVKEPCLHWPLEEDRPQVQSPHGKTIQEAFLRICDRMKDHVACADENSSILTYKRMLMAAIILSQKIKLLKGDYIGVLLPSSVGAYLTILGILLSGKTPVMLNWTVGPKTLEYAVDLLNIEVILSSHKFLNRLENADLGEIDEKIQTLEDIKHAIGLKDKIKALLLSSKKPSTIIKKLDLSHSREDDPAVILFTSGTETLPKAVPLSHKNLLENQKAALQCIDFSYQDILYGVLPPFHSFGFVVTGLLPILTGLKVFFSPDPTDAAQMAHDISLYRLTIMVSAPTFLMNLLAVAEPKQLKTVRLFAFGAEKAPEELFRMIERLGPSHKMVEGYGITECSPIVTINRPSLPIKGVGQPLSNVQVCIINPETFEVLGRDQVGEICIRGPSVFNGYLGAAPKNPFIEIEGQKWYRSGDLGSLDENQYLTLSGRIKRFIKIGGEMVSLGALEDALLRKAKENHWYKGDESIILSIAANEKKDKPELILFTVFHIAKEDINEALKQSGFSRLLKISHVEVLKTLPLTGTGKLHYRRLNEMAEAILK